MSDEAQRECDRHRRRLPHLKFFIGDPPCSMCVRNVADKRAKRERKVGR